MRPMQLTLSGFRSFRAEQTIDFTGLELFAMVGDTGAGKSSLLEAMVYALYNKTTWDERGVKALIALDADTMVVHFTFAAAGRRFEVLRSASRIVGRPAMHRLRCPEDSEFRFDGESAVNAAIIKSTGIDYDTFIKAVVLPQGRFADLLTSNEGTKAVALTQLLGLEEIDRIRDAIDAPRQQAREQLVGLRALLETLGDPASRIESLRAGHVALERERERFSTLVVAAEANSSKAVAIGERLRAFESAAKDLATLHEQLGVLRALQPHVAELENAIADARSRHAAARAEHEAAQLAESNLKERRMDGPSISDAKAKLQQLREKHEALFEATRFFDGDVTAQASEDADLERRRCDLEVATGQHAASEIQRADAAEKARGASGRELAGLGAWHRLNDARAAVKRCEEVLASTRSAMVADRVALDNASASLSESQSKLEHSKGAFAKAQNEHTAALLGHYLHVGDACPVCTQPVPSDYRASDAPDLTGAREALAEAESAVARATREHATAQERAAASARSESDGIAAHTEAKRAVAVAERDALAASVEPEAPNEETALRGLRTVAKRAEDEAQRTRTATSELERWAIVLQAEFDAAGQALAERRARTDAFRARLERDRQRIEAARMALPVEFRPARLDDEAFQATFGRLGNAEKVALVASERASACGEAQLHAERACGELERRFAREINVPATAARTTCTLMLHSLTANSEVAALGEMPSRPSDDIAAAIALASDLTDWCSSLNCAMGAARAKVEVALKVALMTLQSSLSEGKATTIDELRANATACTRGHTIAAERLAQCERDLMKAREAEATMMVVEPLSIALDRLSRYLQNNEFKNYLMRLRERRLLGVATDVLRRMTAGRYAFAERFQILDGLTAQTRDPRTLSGGEKFLASLALALGLVEIASQGGGRLDALFLDEGFGSLDAGALDSALAELAARAHGGKMIGIITHVRSIAAEIDTVLRVRRLPGGSTVTRLSGDEREQFLDDDVSGLLEEAG